MAPFTPRGGGGRGGARGGRGGFGTLLSLAAVAVLLATAATAWQVNLWPNHGNAVYNSNIPPVAVNDAMVLWPYTNGPVFAVNTTTRKLMWGITYDGVEALIAVPASEVVLIATSEVVFAYSVPTGRLLWINETIAAVATVTPLVVGDTVIFNGYSYNSETMGVVAFSAATGDMIFNAFVGQLESQLPVVALSSTVAGFSGSMGFVAFDIANGAQLWTATGADVAFVAGGDGYVAISNSSINQPAALAANDREVVILNAATGARVWRFRAMTGAASSNQFARIYKGNFYALVSSVALQCYSLKTGTMLWALPLTYASSTNQFRYGGDQFVMATQVYYYDAPVYSIVDAMTGDSVVDLNQLASNTAVTFALLQGVVVAPNTYGFQAFNTTTGALLFENTGTSGLITSSLLLTRSGLAWSNGTAVFGDNFSG